jgi:exonuclease SbcC
MIQRLRVRQWGPFDDSTIEFDEDKNVILGDNFSGKTSLVNAIFYSLSGEVLAPKAKPADFAKANSKDSIVELDFTINGSTYRIRRRPTRKQSHLFEMQDGVEKTEIVSGPGVDLRVAYILGFGATEMSRAVFMKEGDVAEYLASTTTGKRKDFVKSIVKLDRLEDIVDAAKQWQTEVNRSLREIKTVLETEQSKVRELRNKPLIGERAHLETDIKGLEERKVELSTKLKGLEDIAEREIRLEREQQRLESLQDKKRSLDGKIGTEKGPYSTPDEIRAESQTIMETQEQLEQARKEEREAQSKVDMARGQRSSIDQALRSVTHLKEEGGDECPTCHQKITPDILGSIISDKKKELSKLDSTIEEAEKEIQTFRKTRETIQTRIERRAQLEQKVKSLSGLIDDRKQVENDIAAFEKIVEDLREGLPETPERGMIESDLSEVDNRLAEAKRSRDQTIMDQASLKEAELRIDEQIEREKALEEKKTLVKILRTATEETIIDFGERPIKVIEQLTIDSLMQLGVFEGWHLDLVKNNLLPVVERENESIQAATMSASEKMLCFLAIRFALARFMAQSGFMVLDEPTEHLDAEHVKKIREFLSHVRQPEQIIVTTNNTNILEGDWANVVKV